jgi:hypothetical protein
MNYADMIGRFYYKFQIGFSPMSYALSLIGFLTFAKVWQGTFEYYGIPFAVVVVGMPVCVLATAALIGHYMITKNIQSAMTSLINTEGNPEFAEMCRIVKEIREKMDD